MFNDEEKEILQHLSMSNFIEVLEEELEECNHRLAFYNEKARLLNESLSKLKA